MLVVMNVAAQMSAPFKHNDIPAGIGQHPGDRSPSEP
jgi:hypothetical protein